MSEIEDRLRSYHVIPLSDYPKIDRARLPLGSQYYSFDIRLGLRPDTTVAGRFMFVVVPRDANLSTLPSPDEPLAVVTEAFGSLKEVYGRRLVYDASGPHSLADLMRSDAGS